MLEDFRNKTVVDLGCGSGQHIGFVAPYAEKIVGVDLNTADIAGRNTLSFLNIEIVETDIAEFS
ncbi:MAG: class I SAM-dependent methyltransferase [Elusimicrobia bacterium]|nr:class I SAM-dependent methyltransferase [Elusimicrobiota bacterium]